MALVPSGAIHVLLQGESACGMDEKGRSLRYGGTGYELC